jgi:hypothetical protein
VSLEKSSNPSIAAGDNLKEKHEQQTYDRRPFGARL